MMNFPKFWPIILVLAIAILLRLPFLGREFVLEEALHIKVVKAIAETGYPTIYYGEQQPTAPFVDRAPFLFFFFVPAFKLLGESEVSARLVLLMFSLAELFLLIYFAKRLFPKPNSTFISFLAGLLFAVNPYVIQSQLQIHFDNAIYTFFTTFFLLLSLEKIINKQNSWKDHIQLALILFFAFAIKYETTLMAAAVVVISSFFLFRQFVKKILISTFASIAVFFGLFYLYNLIYSHSEQFLVPVERILWVFQKIFLPKYTTFEVSLTVRSLWASNYYLLIRFLSWLSAPAILLSFYTFLRIGMVKKLRGDPKIIFLTIWGGFFFLVYALGGWAGDYPRYFAPTISALSLLIGAVVVDDFIKFKKQFTPKVLVLTIVISGILIIIAQKTGLLFLDHITGWIPKLQNPFFVIIFAGISAILILVKLRAYLFTLLLLLFLTLGQFTLQNIHNIRSDFSLTNFYGHGGYRDAGKFLKNELAQNATIFTFDPVAYYWEGKYFDYYLIISKPEKYAKIVNALKSEQIEAVALPSEFINTFSTVSKNYGLDFQKFLTEKFKNYQNLGGQLGIEVYY